MKEESLVESVVEEQTIEEADIAPVSDVLGEVAVEEQLTKIVSEAVKASMVFDWSPLGDEAQIGHGLNLLGAIIEEIPELQASRSKGQNICLRFLGKKPVARLWFSKSKVVMNTMAVSESGKGGTEPKSQSRYMPENGFPVKTRKKMLAEIRRYIKARNFKVPAPEAEA